LFLLLSITAFFIAASKGTSISAAAEALAFAIAVALVIAGAYAILRRFPPKSLIKFSSFVQAADKIEGAWLAGILFVLVAMAVSKWTFTLLEYLVIYHLYGQAAWVDGLRIINKHGGLSNGDYLTGWSYLMPYLGSFILTAPIAIGSFYLFRYIGFRFRGRGRQNERH
jgi:hypothetical protein